MFHRFPAHFDPFTSIWEFLVKIKIDMKNVDFIRFSCKCLICGFNSEISTWKLFFQKVQMILYILSIYQFFLSRILNELCSSEDTCKIIRFGHKCFKYCTSELTKSTVRPLWFYRCDQTDLFFECHSYSYAFEMNIMALKRGWVKLVTLKY